MRHSGLRRSRGQSAGVGFVLVLGLVLAVSALVVSVGGGAIDDLQRSADIERAESAMTQLDASLARVALGDAPAQRVQLPTTGRGSVEVVEDAGSVTIEIDRIAGTDETIVNDQTLGAVVYEAEGSRIAYQGGGVWRKGEGDARMVSPPEFHYRGATLTFPLVRVTGTADGEGVRIRPSDLANRRWPDPANGNTNPVDSGTVVVTVQSDYYRGWGQYFETRTDGTVEYDDSQREVTLTLTSPVRRPPVTAAVSASTGTGELRIEGSGGYTDSYDSDTGDYAATVTNGGQVIVNGDVTLRGGAEIRGSLRSGGEVDLGGSSFVTGDLQYYDAPAPDASKVGGDIEQTADRPATIDDLDTVVEQRVNDIQSTNDNGAEGDIGGTSLDSGAITIGEAPGAQSFALDRIDRSSGETVTIDTSNGDVTIAVEEYVQVESATIEVVGDGRVNVWVAGNGGVSVNVPSGPNFGDAELHLDSGTVSVGPDDDAGQFFIYGKSDFQAAMIDGNFDGVVYAPAGGSGSSALAHRQGNVYGGVVVGTVGVENDGQIHYDRSLADVRSIPVGTSAIRLTYLHVTVNEVELSD